MVCCKCMSLVTMPMIVMSMMIMPVSFGFWIRELAAIAERAGKLSRPGQQHEAVEACNIHGLTDKITDMQPE